MIRVKLEEKIDIRVPIFRFPANLSTNIGHILDQKKIVTFKLNTWRLLPNKTNELQPTELLSGPKASRVKVSIGSHRNLCYVMFFSKPFLFI